MAIVSVKALPSGERLLLGSGCENAVIAPTELAFGVTIQKTGTSEEARVRVTLTIQQSASPIVQTQIIPTIEPGDQKTLVFRNLGHVQFATKTTVAVRIRWVPGEADLTDNFARYP